MERIWRKNEKEIRTKKIMYPHLPDGDRSGYGADFYHADRSGEAIEKSSIVIDMTRATE